MKQLSLIIFAGLTALTLSACDRDKAGPPTPTSKPDTITPAPVRPGDATTPAVPGPNSNQPPMPDVNKK
jgi:hypothetical protein